MTSARTRTIMVSYFAQADHDLGARLAKAVDVSSAEVNRAIEQYDAANPQQVAQAN